MEKLLPCPFCGAQAELFGEDYPFKLPPSPSVRCESCGANILAKNSEEAIKRWNRRENE